VSASMAVLGICMCYPLEYHHGACRHTNLCLISLSLLSQLFVCQCSGPPLHLSSVFSTSSCPFVFSRTPCGVHGRIPRYRSTSRHKVSCNIVRLMFGIVRSIACIAMPSLQGPTSLLTQTLAGFKHEASTQTAGVASAAAPEPRTGGLLK
jgi:hypothetical protein